MSLDKFEKNIKSKVSIDVSSDFDQKFWNKFEKSAPKKKFESNFFTNFALPMAFAALAFALVLNFQANSPDPMHLSLAADEAIQSIQVLSNVDAELLDLSDEELQILLEENS